MLLILLYVSQESQHAAGQIREVPTDCLAIMYKYDRIFYLGFPRRREGLIMTRLALDITRLFLRSK